MKVTAIFASLLLASAAAASADGKGNVQRLRSYDVGRNLKGKPTSGPPGQSGSAPGQQSKAAKHAKAAPKVKICHYEEGNICPYQNKEISENALPGHMDHHEKDKEGTCQDLCNEKDQNYDPDTCTCYSEDEDESLSMSMSMSMSTSLSLSATYQ